MKVDHLSFRRAALLAERFFYEKALALSECERRRLLHRDRQLRPPARRDGSGDIALDVEAVRKALGYDKIDYYAFSYGTVPEHFFATLKPGNTACARTPS
jgi:pimeloyl-ACP methyl ester carboxylesterase